jgi:SAM-dependent methyltransferase
MSDPKAFYQTYRADDKLGPLNLEVIRLIKELKPTNVFEFGSGTGKNLKPLHDEGIVTFGIDISPLNFLEAHFKNGLPFVALGTEAHLGHLRSFDVAFTVSVLDHIIDVTKIIQDLKNLAPVVFLAEPQIENHLTYYYFHDYEKFGFKDLGFRWTGEDGYEYKIWKFDSVEHWKAMHAKEKE